MLCSNHECPSWTKGRRTEECSLCISPTTPDNEDEELCTIDNLLEKPEEFYDNLPAETDFLGETNSIPEEKFYT